MASATSNPYYYGRAEDIDPTYLYLIRLLEQVMNQAKAAPTQVGPGGSYNPFAWMDEGGLTPAQKRAADEARQAADAKQATEWNLSQPGIRDYLGKPSGEGEFTYQPTAQDLATWKAAEQIGMMQNLGVPSAPSRGGERRGERSAATRTTGGPGSQISPDVMKELISTQREALGKQLASIDAELKAQLGAFEPNEERIKYLQERKAELMEQMAGGGIDKIVQLMSLTGGGPRGGGIITKGEGWEKPSATKFGTPSASEQDVFTVGKPEAAFGGPGVPPPPSPAPTPAPEGEEVSASTKPRSGGRIKVEPIHRHEVPISPAVETTVQNIDPQVISDAIPGEKGYQALWRLLVETFRKLNKRKATDEEVAQMAQISRSLIQGSQNRP